MKAYLHQALNSSIKIILVGIVSFLCTTAAAPENLPKGKFEVGLFQPLQYGLSEKIEISTHPVLMFFIPNFAVQKSHPNWAGLGLDRLEAAYIGRHCRSLLVCPSSGKARSIPDLISSSGAR